ncbi:TPA: restriction endonuclease subunit S [Acinetobacter baumannii]|nr:restriction endonuclease subunit S [Acinetobacter baumannii]HEN9532227.1 restriction endonuclease subunit S [Acinetobacter baumannii]HEN9567523.1 restriction endonuclease subunit S [Acinetobacter baumannii]HEO0816977.1 restriction endonuclease subunit S [Acinetobacter baumannii]
MVAPKLRFKEFDGEWNNFELGTLGYFINGLTYAPENIVEKGLLVLRSSNVQNGELAFEDNVFVDLNVDQEKLTQKNDILICVRNGSKSLIGKNALIKDLPCSATHGAFMTVFRSGLGEFVYQLLQTKRYYEYIYADLGATINSINGNNLKKYKFYLPEKKEQTKIASFLSSVDEKISQLTQKHELLSQYKQGMMQKLFSQQIRFKADDGSEFGEWEDKPLNEIASKRSGKNKDGSISEVLTNSATQGIIKQGDYFEREIVTESNLNGYYIVNLDDFVYNPRISVHAPVGPIKRNKKCLGVMSPLYTVFTVIQGNLKYLEYFFDSNFWHDYVKGVANSGARHDRMNITNKDFFDMPILYPCLEEQTKIANFLSAIDQKIEVVAQQIEQAKTWKKGLLQQMFV